MATKSNDLIRTRGCFLIGSDNQKTSSGQTVHHLLKSRQLQRIPVVGQEAVSQKDHQMKGTVGRIRQQVVNPPDEARPSPIHRQKK